MRDCLHTGCNAQTCLFYCKKHVNDDVTRIHDTELFQKAGFDVHLVVHGTDSMLGKSFYCIYDRIVLHVPYHGYRVLLFDDVLIPDSHPCRSDFSYIPNCASARKDQSINGHFGSLYILAIAYMTDTTHIVKLLKRQDRDVMRSMLKLLIDVTGNKKPYNTPAYEKFYNDALDNYELNASRGKNKAVITLGQHSCAATDCNVQTNWHYCKNHIAMFSHLTSEKLVELFTTSRTVTISENMKIDLKWTFSRADEDKHSYLFKYELNGPIWLRVCLIPGCLAYVRHIDCANEEYRKAIIESLPLPMFENVQKLRLKITKGLSPANKKVVLEHLKSSSS
jgi:hypothetical protein